MSKKNPLSRYWKEDFISWGVYLSWELAINNSTYPGQLCFKDIKILMIPMRSLIF